MSAAERQRVIAPQAFDDLHRLLQAAHAHRGRLETNAGLVVLRLQPAGANAELEASTTEHVDTSRLLGQQGRMAKIVVENRA